MALCTDIFSVAKHEKRIAVSILKPSKRQKEEGMKERVAVKFGFSCFVFFSQRDKYNLRCVGKR